ENANGAKAAAPASSNGHGNGRAASGGRYGIDGYMFAGELALDGSLRPIRGALPIAIMAREQQIPRLVVPLANAAEAAVVRGVEVYGARNLHEVLDWVTGRSAPAPVRIDAAPQPGLNSAGSADFAEDFAEV